MAKDSQYDCIRKPDTYKALQQIFSLQNEVNIYFKF
jgi:hypothetical protein